MFSQLFSKTSWRRIFSYLNNFSLPPLYQLSSLKKSILNSPILNTLVFLKTILIGLFEIFSRVFQNQLFQFLTLHIQTKEQIRIYFLFHRRFFEHNYQLSWDSKFQDACTNFLSQFSKVELLPFIAHS